MVLGSNSSPYENPSPGKPPRRRQNTRQAEKDKSDRESKDCAFPEQNLHSPKERLPRREIDSGPLNPQLLHKVPHLQNANPERDQDVVTEEFLDNIFRSQGRLLARAHKPPKEILPKLPLEESKLAIQSHAFRPERSPTHFHQADSTRGKSDGRSRDMVPPISRRPPNNSLIGRGMQTQNPKGNGYSEFARLDSERTEVTSHTSSRIRMVRRILRPPRPLGNDSHRDYGVISTSVETPDNRAVHLSARRYATTRPRQLDKPPGPNSQTNPSQNKENHQIPQKTGLGYTSHTEQELKTQYLQIDQRLPYPKELRFPIPQHYHSDRRLPERLGIPNKQQMLRRQLRQINVLLNKCSGNTDSLVLSTDGRREGSSYPNSNRQWLSHSSNQKECIPDIPPLDSVRLDMEESSITRLDSHHITHTRLLQRDRRSTIPSNGDTNRMVSGTRRLPENPQTKSPPASRSICHQPEQPTTDICLSMSRQQGSGSGLPDNTLEQVEASIPVPSHSPDFEGSSEVDRVQLRECSFDYSQHANETMVHGVGTSEDSFNSVTSSFTASSSRSSSGPTTSFPASRLETIMETLSGKFPIAIRDAIDAMAKPIRVSSRDDYQQKWTAFLKYLKDNNVSREELLIDWVFNFLWNELFIRRQLKPTTVEKYKTALMKPLRSCGIDLNIEETSDFIRALKILRPDQPSQDPHWNLNKVLKYIDEEMPDHLSDEELLRKTAFLLLLASGMRISELHACLRTEVSCKFTADNFLQLSHHPLFLAKNEAPTKRWKFKVIKPLISRDGNINKLCPVTSLKTYLGRSSIKTGRLFRSTNKAAKELTKNQLSTEVCKLIIKADPGTRAKVHDVRSYASSTSLATTMITPTELAESIGWSSPQTFYKFYRKAIEPLTREVSLPGPDPRGQSN